MKIKSIYLAFAVAFLASCSSLLDEKVESFVQPDKFYRNASQARAGLDGCYIPLRYIYTSTLEIATEGVTDLCYSTSGTQDSQLDISPANPRFGKTMWTQCYKGVRYCNDALYGLERSPMDSSSRVGFIAAAKVMRAMYYYLLTAFFGDVPFWDYPVTSIDVLQKIRKLPRMSAADTRDYLVDDLKACLDSLPKARSYDIGDQRMGYAAGCMVLAKLAMWNSRWEDASAALSSLETLYGDLADYPIADISFRCKNTPESIFEVQHTYTKGGLSVTNTLAPMCIPQNHVSGTCIYSGVEIEELGTECTTWAPISPNKYFYEGLMPETAGDLRRDLYIVSQWNGQKFKDSDGKTITRPYLGPKFWCPYMVSTYDSNNYKVFRYADAVLMQAECLCRMDRFPEALTRLNSVKNRAGIRPASSFSSQSRFMEEIQKERGRELFCEFQRKFDLVRWGIWYQSVLDFNDYSTVKDNLYRYKEYYPIPDSECGLSGGALDNKAYE